MTERFELRARFTPFLCCLALPMAELVANSADAEGLPSSVVYVESNAGPPDGNFILAYRIDGTGSVTPVDGSPFPVGGYGTGNVQLTAGQFDSDQNVIVSPDRARLFAVNSGSNSIAVFDIGPGGMLTAVKGSPFPSGGVNPVSVGLAGNQLYVIHKGDDSLPDFLPNYSTFQVTPDGQLIQIPKFTVEIPAGSSPTQALISPDDSLLFDANFGSSMLRSFRILDDGRLQPNEPQDSSPPLGLQVHPTQSLLYVGYVASNELAVYSYDASGTLQFLSSVPDSGRAICWLAIDRAGACLYAANTGDNSVSAFDLTDPTEPVEVQRLLLAGAGLPFQIALDPSGAILNVVSQRANTLHLVRVDPGCALTELDSSPLALPVPENTRIQGVAVIAQP